MSEIVNTNSDGYIYTSRAWSNGVGSLLSNDPTFTVAVAMPMNACSGDSQMVVGKGEMNADGGEL